MSKEGRYYIKLHRVDDHTYAICDRDLGNAPVFIGPFSICKKKILMVTLQASEAQRAEVAHG